MNTEKTFDSNEIIELLEEVPGLLDFYFMGDECREFMVKLNSILEKLKNEIL